MQPTLWDDTADILTDWDLWQAAQGLSDRTRAERRGVITALLETTATTPRTLHQRAVIRYCARDGLAASSKATYHATIRAFCTWMIRAKIRIDDPTIDTPRPKRPRSRPRPLHMIDVQAIYNAANRRRTRAYIALAILAGLRVHEIAKVRGEDFDLHGESLTVTGKGGVTELLPLAPELLELARKMPKAGYWFPRYEEDSAQHVTRSGVHAAIKRTMQRAGVTATPHQLRHSYGTELLNAGANIRVVQDLMRHASIETTQGYTDVQWTAKRYAIHTLRLAA